MPPKQERKSRKIIMMDLFKAFGCANRGTLWAALCKEGLPTQAIQNIRQGHQDAKLQRKGAVTYGEPIRNNVGVSQESAISALLFVIYLDDAMQDRRSLNGQMQLPKRYSAQPKGEVRTNHRLTYIARKQSRKQKQPPLTRQQKTTMHDITEQETTARTDEVIYADDTNMITEHDATPQISKKIQN